MNYSRDRIILTAEQAARVCKISPSTLRTWVDRGHITRRRRNRYDLAEILAYLDGRLTSRLG